MEKRFFLGVFLLIFLLVSGLIASSFLYHTHMPEAVRLQEDQSATSIEEANRVWKKNWKLTATLIDHTPGEQIDSLFEKLQYLKDPQLAKSTCQELAVQLRAIAESQLLLWWNIL